MPTPNSSIATADSCAFCAPGSAGSFATSVVRSQAARTSRRHSCGHSRAPIRSARSSSTSAAGSCIAERAYVDKGYRGHHTPNPRRVFMSGQKRGVFGRIKRELRRRSAIEAVIGHMKAEGHLGRCYLKGRAGDAANVILSAVGYNLRLVLAWLRTILRVVLLALFQTFAIRLALKPAF